MNEIYLALIEIGFGLFLAVHCPRAAVREWRAGVAEGIGGSIPREEEPGMFWFTIGATASAGLLGLGFVVMGIATAT